MHQSTLMNLIGIHVIGQDGRAIGVVTDMHVETDNWQLQSLTIELNRQTLEDLKLKRPWLGTQVVQVPISEISGASDALVLKCSLEEMPFTGGTPAIAESPSQNQGSDDDPCESG